MSSVKVREAGPWLTLFARLPACLLAGLPVCLSVCLLAYLPASPHALQVSDSRCRSGNCLEDGEKKNFVALTNQNTRITFSSVWLLPLPHFIQIFLIFPHISVSDGDVFPFLRNYNTNMDEPASFRCFVWSGLVICFNVNKMSARRRNSHVVVLVLGVRIDPSVFARFLI